MNPASVNLAFLQPFENFVPKKESFKYYCQRFENFLEMKKITSNRQWSAQMFLNSVGGVNYNMLAAFVSPRTPAELTNEELMNTFEVHLCLKKNVLVSQHHFLSTYRAETQTIADYIGTLRHNIIDCEFISPCECYVSIADIFLCGQFVCGIHDNSIHEQIPQSEILAFHEIAKNTVALEASKTDSLKLSKKHTTLTSANREVSKVFKY
jgi:REP element-mobilizing transposase RayT